jgi:hypothetical protein
VPAARTHGLCSAAFLERCPPCSYVGRSANIRRTIRACGARRDHPVGSGCHELSHCQRVERGIDKRFIVAG